MTTLDFKNEKQAEFDRVRKLAEETPAYKNVTTILEKQAAALGALQDELYQLEQSLGESLRAGGLQAEAILGCPARHNLEARLQEATFWFNQSVSHVQRTTLFHLMNQENSNAKKTD